MNILVMNSGSSSVKIRLYRTDLERIKTNTDELLCMGSVEKIGLTNSTVRFDPTDKPPVRETCEILEHRVAIQRLLRLIADPQHGVLSSIDEIDAVGHRFVHGGEKFSQSVLIDGDVLDGIEACVELAPLHNPHNLKGYTISRELLARIPHVAVFDTAFHQTMQPHVYLYGLPYILYKRHGIRRYGFHGTSHRYVSFRLSRLLGRPRETMKIITIHLGNGCSMAAVDGGKSVDTSMGFTPLEGLIMGTRCGDLDPAVILQIMDKEEIDVRQANALLNKHSGLYGISGLSNDMRELEQAAAQGDNRAALAIDMFCYRITKYIGAYAAAMNGVDAVIFTGGIGENSPLVRGKVCRTLGFLGITVDDAKNEATVKGVEGSISADGTATQVWVIPTNEELIIARDTCRLVLTGDPRPRNT